MPPGAMALTVIRFGPASAEKDRVNASTAALEPEYRAWFLTPVMLAATDDMKMIRPPSARGLVGLAPGMLSTRLTLHMLETMLGHEELCPGVQIEYLVVELLGNILFSGKGFHSSIVDDDVESAKFLQSLVK